MIRFDVPPPDRLLNPPSGPVMLIGALALGVALIVAILIVRRDRNRP